MTGSWLLDIVSHSNIVFVRHMFEEHVKMVTCSSVFSEG